MEPVRLLRKRGIEPHLYYANPNIAPAEEYARRRDTIAAWADGEGVSLTEGDYDPDEWEATAGRIGDASTAIRHKGEPSAETKDDARRKARCRACYRLRFERAASYAKSEGFDALGTTLSVSPYQYTNIIREELERACKREGIACFFEDYSPQYSEATRRSREAGMYRQNYCGCRFSESEAAAEREERAEARAAEKARRVAERAPEERKIAQRRAERAAYDARQAHRRQILKELRMERASQAAQAPQTSAAMQPERLSE